MVRYPHYFIYVIRRDQIIDFYQSEQEEYIYRNLLDDKSDDTHAYEDDAHKIVL